MRITPLVVGFCMATTVVHTAHVPRARACGGLVQPATGTVAQSGQLAIVSVHDGVTDVVLTLAVPSAGNAFGVLVPVPEEPVIDETPVDTTAMDELEVSTRPVLAEPGNDDGGGGCGCSRSLSGDGLANRGGVNVGEAVNIGPVTAQWLSGTDGEAVGDWLTAEGFALSDDAQALIDDYVAAGLSFVAFTRNDDEASADAVRVGVRFTLDGDRRAYALKMTSIGSAEEMAFTIFVGADKAVGPDAPYEALRIADLDADARAEDYPAAIAAKTAEVGGKAFVVETSFAINDRAELSDALPGVFASGQIVTRLSAVLDPNDLDADVTFLSDAPANLDDLGGAGDGEAAGTTSSWPRVPPLRFDPTLLLFALVLLALTQRSQRSSPRPTTSSPAGRGSP